MSLPVLSALLLGFAVSSSLCGNSPAIRVDPHNVIVKNAGTKKAGEPENHATAAAVEKEQASAQDSVEKVQVSAQDFMDQEQASAQSAVDNEQASSHNAVDAPEGGVKPTAQGPNAPTMALLETGAVMNNTVALFDTVKDRSWKCLYGTRAKYDPENYFVEFDYHFPNKKTASGKEKVIPFCLDLTATYLGYFSFWPCRERRRRTLGQVLYFDGKSCYIGWFDIFHANHCLMWVNTDYKDSLPEECLKLYDEKCGPRKYTLYDKDECS